MKMPSIWHKIVIVKTCLIVGIFGLWQEEIKPKTSIALEEGDILRFHGNRSHPDHFKLLEVDGDSILIGARNIVYNIDLPDLKENEDKRITWQPNSSHKEMCLIKGKSDDDCQNYIRILAKTDDDRLLVCGTNAYSPLCRYYSGQEGAYSATEEFSGKGRCPYDPNHNSTAVYTDSNLYVATVSDFSASDPLIYREPLRTEQYDLKQLNAPNFVGSLADGDYVYYFMRETAVEYINCGKAVYSRVARVCKHDRGGSHKFANRWTSFLKARLNCSVPGEYPFYFDEIQSVSDIVVGTYGNKTQRIIYGVFATPENSIRGSAICAFNLPDVEATFDGAFKEQEKMDSNWLPVPPHRVPEPRPGACTNDSRTLPDVNLNFIKSHTLMDQAVPSMFGQPILIRTSVRSHYSKIVVDPQVWTPGENNYDVIIVGTDDGKIIRSVNIAAPHSTSKIQPIVIEEIQVLPANVPITNLKIIRSKNESKLIVVTDDEIIAIPLYRCPTKKTCSGCVALQDPYCAWDSNLSKCVPTAGGKSKTLVHNIITGKSDKCPPEISTTWQPTSTTELPNVTTGLPTSTTESPPALEVPLCATCGPCDCPVTSSPLTTSFPPTTSKLEKLTDPAASATLDRQVYTAETFTVAVVTSCFVALVVGFVAGLVFSRRCRNDYGTTSFLENRKNPRRCVEADMYLPPSKMNNLINNQVSKVANEKNANMSTLDKSTLPKVKKTYV